jgi:hypothetical protein
MGNELDRSTLRSLGGVLARGLIKRVEGKGESIPVGHVLSIVVSAAAKVEAAHATGARLYATPDTVMVRYDGTVELRGTRVPQGSDPHADVRALGRLLVELLTGVDLPGDAAATIATTIDRDRGAKTAAELAKVCVQLGRDLEVILSQQELGRFARRQIYNNHLDTPPSGVESKPEYGYAMEDSEPVVIEAPVDEPPRLARGSQEFRDHELPPRPKRTTNFDFEKMMKQAVEGSAPATPPLATDVRASRPRMTRAPSIQPVALPAASGTTAGEAKRGATRLVGVFAVLMILGAVGFVVCAAYPDAAASVAALFR